MIIICPLCRERVSTYYGQYTDGRPDGSIHIAYHSIKVYIRKNASSPSFKINCLASGEPLLSIKEE